MVEGSDELSARVTISLSDSVAWQGRCDELILCPIPLAERKSRAMSTVPTQAFKLRIPASQG
eukprot:6155244-Pyramimonas_sp.AAC.1